MTSRGFTETYVFTNLPLEEFWILNWLAQISSTNQTHFPNRSQTRKTSAEYDLLIKLQFLYHVCHA